MAYAGETAGSFLGRCLGRLGPLGPLHRVDTKVCYWYTAYVDALVLDSSALVTLAQADALPLLRLSAHEAVTVPEVYRETVEAGLARGHPDALAIREAFERGLIRVRGAGPSGATAEGRHADPLVLALAERMGAAALLVNDRSLFRRAFTLGLPAQLTIEFVQDLLRGGKITRPFRDSLLQKFIARGRYTSEFIEAFHLLME